MKQAKAAAGITGSAGRHGVVGEIIPSIISRFVRRVSKKAIVPERPGLQGTRLDAFVQEDAVDVSGGDVSDIERGPDVAQFRRSVPAAFEKCAHNAQMECVTLILPDSQLS